MTSFGNCAITVILRQLRTGRDAVFDTTPTPTVCYSVLSIVEVSGGCQSVNIYVCANEGLL